MYKPSGGISAGFPNAGAYATAKINILH